MLLSILGEDHGRSQVVKLELLKHKIMNYKYVLSALKMLIHTFVMITFNNALIGIYSLLKCGPVHHPCS